MVDFLGELNRALTPSAPAEDFRLAKPDQMMPGSGHTPTPTPAPAPPARRSAPPAPARIAATATPEEQAVASAGPEIRSREGNVETTGQQYANLFGQVGARLQAIQEERAGNLSRVVAAKDAVNQSIESETAHFQEQVQPIFARRAAIAHRQTELATMNPLKRAIMGFVDRNYNPRDLQGLDQALTQETQVAGQEYEASTQAHARLLDVMTQRYAGQDAISGLEVANLNEDLKLGETAWGIQRQRLGDSAQALGMNIEQIRAQASVRDGILTRATAGDLNAWSTQAQRNGGTAVINGVPVSAAEIQQRSRQLDQQSLALESAQLSLTSQRQAVKDQAEARLIEHMSPTEIQGAIQNGGQFQGMRLNQERLTQAYASSQQRLALGVQATTNGMDAQTYTRFIDSHNLQVQDQMRRIQGITGNNMPAQYRQYVTGVADIAGRFAEQLRHAPNEEVRQQLRTQYVQQITQLQGKADGVMDHIAQGMTDDPDAQIVLGAWLKGNQPTGEQAVRGVIALLQGGALPPGLRLGGPAGNALNAAKSAMDRFYAENDPNHGPNNAGNPQNGRAAFEQLMRGNGPRETKENMRRRLQERVTQAMSASWSSAHINDYIASAPSLAQRANDPAGRINPADLRSAFLRGDEIGYGDLGRQLNMTSDQARQIFGPNGRGESGWQQFIAQTPNAPAASLSYSQAQSALSSAQLTAGLRELDRSPSANHDFRPSVALAHFMNSDTYQNFIASHQDQTGAVSLGSMLGDAISGGSPRLAMRNVAQNIYNAAATNVQTERTDIQRRLELYRGDPVRRTSTILAAIPGLNQHDETLLVNQVKQVVQNGGDADQIDSTIMHGRFQDPQLERIRRVAAQHWQEFAPAVDRATERFSNMQNAMDHVMAPLGGPAAMSQQMMSDVVRVTGGR